MNTKTVAVAVIAIIVVVAVAGAAYWLMNDNGDADATYTVSMSYDSETGHATGAGTYSEGETVTVTATPADGYGFKGWFNGTVMVSDESNYSFEASSDVVLTPSFRVLYTISVDYDSEYGIVQGAGEHMEGDECSLAAIPNSGCSLAGWYDQGNLYSTSKVWSFVVTGDRHFYADMGEDGVIVTVLYDNTMGAVTPSTIGSVDYGTEIHLLAEANIREGYAFNHWIINGEVSDNDYELRMIITEDTVIEAEFTLRNYQASVFFDDSMGNVSGVSNESYVYGTVLHLQATPNPGYVFDHWEINSSTYTSSELSYTVTGNVSIRVVFVMT